MARLLSIILALAFPPALHAAEGSIPHAHLDKADWMLLLGVVAFAITLSIYLVARRFRIMHTSMEHLTSLLKNHSEEITELDAAKEAYKNLYDLALVAIFRSTMDGSRFLAINQTGARMFGYATEKEMLASVIPKDVYLNKEHRAEMLAELHRAGQVQNFHCTFVRKDDSTFHAIFSAKFNQEEGCVEGTIQDVTSLKLAEQRLEESRDFLQNVIDAIPIPVAVRNTSGIFTLANDEFAAVADVPKEKLIGGHPRDIFPLPVVLMQEEYDRELLNAKGKATQRVEQYRPRLQPPATHLVYENVLLDSNGKVAGLVGATIDITARKRMEEELRKAEERYRNIFMNSIEGIFTSTVGGTVISANPAMARLYGYDTPEYMLKSIRNLAIEHWVYPEKRAEMLKELIKTDHLSGYEAEIRRRDGEHIWVSLSIRAIRNNMGILEALEGVAVDVTGKKRSEQELAQRANTDPLTGLANRAYMEQTMEHMVAQAKRSDKQIGVLFIDLDQFKPINDTYGHEAGDTLLREVSSRLKARLRESDVAARIGGDEFVIILWDIKGREALYRVGRPLLEELNKPYAWENRELRIGASIGGSLYPEHGETPGDLLRCADKAMYDIKQSGKNALRISPPSNDNCRVEP
ncbi:diguanylate cyclase [Desulfovibrio mangrovi]|uniref:sensor domain-containing protein n=1 Tax=Desulfovibrio mangrovi TaxID=2976983 RepID=UPI002245E54A|nr:sensor domain-containing diguanylate cyclase [Desulfovibrio mangrovi]UZP68936.1 diguanylate cyclase [Desulfovibrio mangrovi]